jgi:aspartyl-tRNA(Asn)/glutamyl-tRNA(Gln) amidotransferase subunit A
VTDGGRMTENAPHLIIADIVRQIRDGKISPVEIVDGCLRRIDAGNGHLNAFALVLADEARAQARQAEAEISAGHWRGPLHGVPIGIKDFYDTAHVRTTAAFEKFKSRVPSKDAASVTRLKDAGAIVIGKMNMHQLGMGTTGLESYFGPVRNPWNDAYIPGGSSSGSAAAVAAGLCYATLDTDAIGSCRLPAACCGVVGFKGTYGVISAKGILTGEKAEEAILWLSHPGITTRSAVDTEIVLNLVTERPLDPPRDGPLRLGVATNVTAGDEVTRSFNPAIDIIRTLGHHVGLATAPFDMPSFGDLRTIEADRKTIAARAFGAIDLLLLPTTTTAVPTVEAAQGKPQALSAANTMFANYFGLPAISVPCGFDPRGLPVGLQIVGPPDTDRTVLRLASEYERARRPFKRPAP